MSTRRGLTEKIRSKARELLHADGNGRAAIDCFVGYEEGTRKRVRPAFIYEPQDVDRLIWDDRCTHNLTTYLHQFHSPLEKEPRRVGILVKPCDSRCLNILFQERQVERERIYVVGLTCEGVQTDGQLQERCRRCSERVPVVYDLVMGEVPRAIGQEEYADVARLEAMSTRERLAFWSKEFDRCIRCYACRQACPACYCFECAAEQLDPPWLSIAIDLPQKQFFHVMRAYHLAGRCSDCNAFEEVCPMKIPLSLLNRKIATEVQDLFGYRTGQDAKTPLPLSTFEKEEELVM